MTLLQKGLSKIRQYRKRWQMRFNIDKRKIIHPDKNDLIYRYTMLKLEVTTQVKDP